MGFFAPYVGTVFGDVLLQFAPLGLGVSVQAAFLFSFLGYFAGSVGHWFARWPQAALWLDRLAGLLFWGLAGQACFLLSFLGSFAG